MCHSSGATQKSPQKYMFHFLVVYTFWALLNDILAKRNPCWGPARVYCLHFSPPTHSCARAGGGVDQNGDRTDHRIARGTCPLSPTTAALFVSYVNQSYCTVTVAFVVS